MTLKLLALVVRRLDSAIHYIKLYPLDNIIHPFCNWAFREKSPRASDISLKMNSGLKGVVFVLPWFIVKHLSDPLETPLASRLLGPYETSFRTFDATDYQPIGEQEGLLQILIEIFFGARYQLI